MYVPAKIFYMSSDFFDHETKNHRRILEQNSRWVGESLSRQNRLTALQVHETRRAAEATEALTEVQSQIQVQKEHENLLKSLELNVITKVEYAKKSLGLGVITPNKYIDILIDDGSLDEFDILIEKHLHKLITWREMAEGCYELDPEYTASWLNGQHEDCVSRIESCDDYADLEENLWYHKDLLECAASLNLITHDQCEHFLQVNEQKRKVLQEKLIKRRMRTAFLWLIFIGLFVFSWWVGE